MNQSTENNDVRPQGRGRNLFLKQAHSWVLVALRLANERHGRPVVTAEVVAEISATRLQALIEAYRRDPSRLVARILAALVYHDVAETAGRRGVPHFYMAKGGLRPEQICIPEQPSRRTWLHSLILAEVERRRVPLRFGEIYDLAQSTPEYGGLSRQQVLVTVASLVRTNHLKVVQRVRGIEKNLYLPAGLAPEDYPRSEAGGWLERTEGVFRALWQEHVSQARAKGRRPKGVTTREVREALIRKYPGEPLPNRGWTGSALDYMTRTSPPRLHKTHRPGTRSVIWYPTKLSEQAVNVMDVYASDSDRLREAARRALQRRNQGTLRDFPVSWSEILQVTRECEELHLDNPRAVDCLIVQQVDLERTEYGTSQPHGPTPRLVRVGRHRKSAYYVLEGGPARPSIAAAHVVFWNLQDEWKALDIRTRFDSASECRIPTLRVARVLQLEIETGHILNVLDALLRGTHVVGNADRRRPARARPDRATRSEIELLRDEAFEIRQEISAWLRFRAEPLDDLRSYLAMAPEGWTQQQYREAATRVGAAHSKRVSRTLHSSTTAIRRFVNPDYVYRGSSNPREAASLLMDAADCRMKLMIRYGGSMARRRAMLAASQLDLIRSPEVLLSDLTNPSLDIRIGVLSCLAFLKGNGAVTPAVRAMAESDPIPGVRATALWAYSFLGAPDADELLHERAQVDQTAEVQRFASESRASLALAGAAGWWKV